METMLLDEIFYFVKVVDFGGYTKASKALGIPKSTLSKGVSKLESELGSNLLIRNTRNQSLTSDGERLYSKALPLIESLRSLQDQFLTEDPVIKGHIRIAAPEDIGTKLIASSLLGLHEKYPNLSFDLNLSSKVLNVVKEGFDLAIRIGKLHESELRFKKLGAIELVPVMSPLYSFDAKNLLNPSDLKEHSWVILNEGKTTKKWEMTSGKKVEELKITPQFSSNEISGVLSLVEAGLGLGMLPLFLIEKYLEQGSLIRVAKKWKVKKVPVSLVSAVPTSSSPSLKIAAEHIEKTLSKIFKET